MKFLLLFAFASSVFIAQSQVIVIDKDTTINDTWIVPAGVTLRFEGGRIKGKGRLQGGIIQAGMRQWIFDTALTVNPEGVYAHDFSAMWFGANANNADNYNAIQTALNTCIRNSVALRNCFLPHGVYNISRSLIIYNIYQGNYVGATIRFYGESSFWDATTGTTLKYNAFDGFALGVQVGKGVEIDHIEILGQFKSPEGPDARYYNIAFDNFKDVNARCVDKQYGPYAGIVVDPFSQGKIPADNGYNKLSNYYLPGPVNINGSTGIKVHDVAVGNFVVNVCISPNGTTRNAEILLFENIRLGDGKVGFSSGEDQEKYNVIRGMYSWGRIHTLFITGKYGNGTPGNWYVDGGNIAGRPIRLIENHQSGWFATHIANLFCESLGTIGTITSAMPASIRNCTFDFAFPEQAGQLTLLEARNEGVKFDNCMFRYYNGKTEPMIFSGNPTFENCLFTGQPNSLQSGEKPLFINCKAGGSWLNTK